MIRKTFACTLLAGLMAAAVSAQTVDELIAKNLEARGGKDKIKAVKSVRMTGKMVMGQGMEAPFTLEMARPKKVRMEFTFQGMTGIQAYDGTTGWMVMPFMGKKEPEQVAGDDLKNMDDQADFEGPLVDYKEKGHQVELVGKADVEGTPAYKLKVTKKNGDIQYIYLDAEQYLELKTEGKQKVRGQEVEGETTLGDYKEVNGLIFAFSIHSKPKDAPPGAGLTMTVDKIELNADMPASRFEMPKAEKPAAAPTPPKPPQH